MGKYYCAMCKGSGENWNIPWGESSSGPHNYAQGYPCKCGNDSDGICLTDTGWGHPNGKNLILASAVKTAHPGSSYRHGSMNC